MGAQIVPYQVFEKLKVFELFLTLRDVSLLRYQSMTSLPMTDVVTTKFHRRSA